MNYMNLWKNLYFEQIVRTHGKYTAGTNYINLWNKISVHIEQIIINTHGTTIYTSGTKLYELTKIDIYTHNKVFNL